MYSGVDNLKASFSAKPIVDAVMKDAGLSNEGITGMAQSLAGMLGRPAQPTQAQAGHTAG